MAGWPTKAHGLTQGFLSSNGTLEVQYDEYSFLQSASMIYDGGRGRLSAIHNLTTLFTPIVCLQRVGADACMSLL
jgi:hypothetical protein